MPDKRSYQGAGGRSGLRVHINIFASFVSMESLGAPFLTRRIAKDDAGSPRPSGRGMKAKSFALITFALHLNYIRRDR
ncbi:MAG: hypothetical protein M0Q43_13220, partial [Methanothrix sp.]|nr:hypothetical protein [Methanothrix sp.]